MKVGETKALKCPPADAYGEVNEANVMKVPKKEVVDAVGEEYAVEAGEVAAAQSSFTFTSTRATHDEKLVWKPRIIRRFISFHLSLRLPHPLACFQKKNKEYTRVYVPVEPQIFESANNHRVRVSVNLVTMTTTTFDCRAPS